MMQLVDENEFRQRTAGERSCGHYEFSLYYGIRFSCACGEPHDFKPWMEIVSELPLFRFIVTCPHGLHLTVLKARWNRTEEVRSLEAEFGTLLAERRQDTRG